MTWRFRSIFILIVFLFLLVVLRLFYWQIIKAEELTNLGLSQYGRILTIAPQRGEIKTSDGFPIAANKVSYLVFANPKEIKEKEKIANILSPILDVSKASVSASLSLDRFWVPIQKGVGIDIKNKIESMRLEGVGFEQEYSRFYPEASLSANLIGFVGKDDLGRDKGYFGVEGYYDRLLSGKEGKTIQVMDAFGKPILAKITESDEIDGSSLVLNVDRSIQFIAEKKLKEGIDTYGASSGMVGIMNPKTGGILAMASSPSFDPKNYQDYSGDLYKNSFISDTYEPGSTFKPIVMSSAFEAGVVKPETKCPICDKPVEIGGFTIHTWNDKYLKNINMIEVIQHSDNTGMVYVAEKLGLDKMIDFLKKFGIGDTTGIDLQGETSVPLKPKDSWYKVDLATTGFGQGVSVTPIELLSAVSVIANNGKRMEPHVVGSVETSDGTVVKIPPRQIDTPISEKTARLMTEIMVNAVDKGEASWTRIKGYRIAGKTGTASIPIQGHYDTSNTIASFIGFAPADDPKFVMVVILNKPTKSIYGAETAAPIFFDIAKEILSYYKIPPSGN